MKATKIVESVKNQLKSIKITKSAKNQQKIINFTISPTFSKRYIFTPDIMHQVWSNVKFIFPCPYIEWIDEFWDFFFIIIELTL